MLLPNCCTVGFELEGDFITDKFLLVTGSINFTISLFPRYNLNPILKPKVVSG